MRRAAGLIAARLIVAVLLLVSVAYFTGMAKGFAASASVLPQLCIAALMALSVWLPFASGQLSLAQAGFMALGAYGSAWLTVHHGWPFGAALAAAAIGTAVAGLVVSYPALRLRGIYLAIATLGLGEVIRVVFINLEATGGAFGFSGIGRHTQLWQLFATLVLISALLYGLMRGRIGRAIAAVRQDTTAAAVLGIDITRIRVLTFTLGALLAGIAGAFQAHYVRFITPDNYDLAALVDWLTMMILGGFQTFVGVLAGALVIGTLADMLHVVADWRLTLNAALLIVLLVFRPQGIITREFVRFRLSPRHRAWPSHPAVAAMVADRRHLQDAPPDVVVVESVTKRFGGVTALDAVSFAVQRHSIHALIGPNGAGKTTLFNLMTGLYAADTGAVYLHGNAVGHLRPQAIARRGIARTFQNIRLFGNMTVLENVMLGAHVRTHANALACALHLDRREEHATVARALTLLDTLGLLSRADEPAASLAYGDQRRLEIARALASEPTVLLLDEPAAGMNRAEAARLGNIIRDVRARFGLTVVLIDHDMDFVMTVCDWITVLNFGRVIAAGSPSTVQRDDAVAAAYLGTSHRCVHTAA